MNALNTISFNNDSKNFKLDTLKSFQFTFLKTKYHVELTHGELKLRSDADSLLIQPCDANSLSITTKKDIIDGYDDNHTYSLNVKRIITENNETIRSCHLPNDKITISLNDNLFYITIERNFIKIHADDFDEIIVKSVVSNVISISGSRS